MRIRTKSTLASVKPIEQMILTLRGRRVMLDADLAQIYGVETKALNRAVKRNSERFPPDFVFQLTLREVERLRCQFGTSNRSQFVTGLRSQSVTSMRPRFATGLRSQFVISNKRGGRRYLPYAFAEHGAIMAANILNSDRAITMSVYVVRAFVKMREMLSAHKKLAGKLAELERKLSGRLDIHEKAIAKLFSDVRELLNPLPDSAKRRIGFHRER